MCNACRRALAGTHPDLVVVERTGASLDVDDARTIVARAQRRPLEAARQVLVVPDVHLAVKAAPALLKTLEEPPPPTVFVLLADDLPPELATIASRCVQVPFAAVAPAVVGAGWSDRAWTRRMAGSVAWPPRGATSTGPGCWSSDAGFGERQRPVAVGARPARRHRRGRRRGRRRAAGRSPRGPSRPCGSSTLASWRPWRSRPRPTGARGVPGRKQVEDRHKREERRWRTDDLRMGLAAWPGSTATGWWRALSAATPPRSAREGTMRRRSGREATAIEKASAALGRNANEGLLLEGAHGRAVGHARVTVDGPVVGSVPGHVFGSDSLVTLAWVAQSVEQRTRNA